MTDKKTCLSCRFAGEHHTEPGYDLIECLAPWSKWNIDNLIGSDAGLDIPQPFYCSEWAERDTDQLKS